jgi:hypothetical protein
MLRLGFTFGIIAALSVTSCKARTYSSSKVENADSSADVLRERYGVRVNITTNMATFYESGIPIRRWKVATARNDGLSATPEGRFRFHELTTCVSWQSTRNSANTGPCAADNPLGYLALWFQGGSYGLHGVDSSHIDSVVATTSDGRRQSSGCVRNHPNDIQWLAYKVSELYGANPDLLAKNVASRREASFAPLSKGLALEIGRWPSDPQIDPAVDQSSESACTAENATGFIFSPTELDVTNDTGVKIGVSKPYEVVCSTKNSKNNKTQVFFPNEPAGFGWVDTAALKIGFKKNPKWLTLAQCLNAGNPQECAALCSNAGSVLATTPPSQPVYTPVCTEPNVNIFSTHGRSVTFVHSLNELYRPTAIVDASSERKDGLPFKLTLRHSPSDISNLAFSTPDNGKTLVGFRYNLAWAPNVKHEFRATWNCYRWVGTLQSELAWLQP